MFAANTLGIVDGSDVGWNTLAGAGVSWLPAARASTGFIGENEPLVLSCIGAADGLLVVRASSVSTEGRTESFTEWLAKEDQK
jgi:hypothetical protein